MISLTTFFARLLFSCSWIFFRSISSFSSFSVFSVVCFFSSGFLSFLIGLRVPDRGSSFDSSCKNTFEAFYFHVGEVYWRGVEGEI